MPVRRKVYVNSFRVSQLLTKRETLCWGAYKKNEELRDIQNHRLMRSRGIHRIKCTVLCGPKASQGALVVKNRPANAGDVGDTCLIPGSRRSPGGRHGDPL